MRTSRAIRALCLAAALALPGAAFAQGNCVSRSEGRLLVERGQVMPFPEAARQAGVASDQVVEVQLCRGGGGYVYRVRVLQKNGKVRPVNIPAG